MQRLIWGILAVMLLCAPLAEAGNQGGPDRTGSWVYINQEVKRGADWRQIVKDSPFQLGERRERYTYAGPDGKPEICYEQEFGSYPKLDGSTVSVPMAMEFARQHLLLSDGDAASFVSFYTTHMAYENLICKYSGFSGICCSEPMVYMMEDRPVDLILVTEPSSAELKLAQKLQVGLVAEPVCQDAFVFITSVDNPVDSLTVEQIRDIYSGKIRNWKEVGGRDEAIVAYQREQNSGSQTTMENQVMKGKKMLPPPTVEVVREMSGLVDVVSEYQNGSFSIGYTFRFYLDVLYRNKQIKVLRVDGIAPEDDAVRSRAYPFSTHYFGVIRRDDKEKVGGKFLNWMLSDEGQRAIAQAGYIPLKG